MLASVRLGLFPAEEISYAQRSSLIFCHLRILLREALKFTCKTSGRNIFPTAGPKIRISWWKLFQTEKNKMTNLCWMRIMPWTLKKNNFRSSCNQQTHHTMKIIPVIVFCSMHGLSKAKLLFPERKNNFSHQFDTSEHFRIPKPDVNCSQQFRIQENESQNGLIWT